MKTPTITGYCIALALATTGTAGCRDDHEQATRKAICNYILEPLREQFRKECSQKTEVTFYNGTLANMVKMRDIISEKYNCEREEWKCVPVRGDYLPESEFRAEFGYK